MYAIRSYYASIELASKIVNREINQAGLSDILGAMGRANVQGEEQQKLDWFANEKFKDALAARGEVCGLASEEEDHFVAFDPVSGKKSKYVVLIDPLDGSSNIDVNVSVGTIFRITSYNVCYTKLLRISSGMGNPNPQRSKIKNTAT